MHECRWSFIVFYISQKGVYHAFEFDVLLTFHGLMCMLAFYKPLKYINTIWLGLYVNCQVYLHPIDHRCLTRTQDRKL